MQYDMAWCMNGLQAIYATCERYLKKKEIEEALAVFYTIHQVQIQLKIGTLRAWARLP
jgi:hypothetical protein